MGVKTSRTLLAYCKEEGGKEEEALKLISDSWFLDVNYHIDSNSTLHWACYTGKARLVQVLLACGAEPNVLNKFGLSPLMIAVRCGNQNIVQVLVECPADMNILSHSGKNALTIAALYNQGEIVEYLLNMGARIQDCTLSQCAYLKDSVHIANLLLENGASPNSMENKSNMSSMASAIIFRNMPITQPLTALMTAVVFRNMPLIELLTKHRDIDINQQNNAGFTALHYAQGVGEGQITQHLLTMGADPDIRAMDGTLPAEVAHVKLPKYSTKRFLGERQERSNSRKKRRRNTN